VDSFAASAQLFVMCGIGVLVLRQVPAVASALGGGIAMSTLGGFGAAMNPLRRLSGALGGAGRTGLNAAGRKAGSAAWNSRAGVATRRGMANAFRRKNTLARI
jgi:type IV secretion system protein VirB6